MPPKDPQPQAGQAGGEKGNNNKVLSEGDLSRVPARIHSVTFSGLSDRTRDDFLIRIAKDILLNREVKSFDQLVRRSNELKQQLQHSCNGLFKSVVVTIDSASSPAATTDDTCGDQYKVNVSVEESSLIAGSLMTTTSSSSSVSTPTIETGVRVSNLGGRGESVYLSLSYGTGAKNEMDTSGNNSTTGASGLHGFTVSASKPLVPLRIGSSSSSNDRDKNKEFCPRYPLLSASAYDNDSNFPVNGFRVNEKGASVDYFSHWTSRLTSRTSISSDVRNLIYPVDAILPPHLIDLTSGSFTKTGIRQHVAYDGRSYSLPGKGNNNFSYFPSSGILAEVSAQICSSVKYKGQTVVPGNQSFVKQDANVQVNQRIPGTRILLQACARAGLIVPIEPVMIGTRDASTGTGGGEVGQSNNNSVSISERYFIGGPLTMRGFGHFGVGPSIAHGNIKLATGSSIYWNTGLHAYVPLPFIARHNRGEGNSITKVIDKCVRMHLFANAAAASNPVVTGGGQTFDSKIQAMIRSVSSNVRTSVGAGLVIAAGPVLRFELNYAIPVHFDSVSDSPDRGFQFGFGINFN